MSATRPYLLKPGALLWVSSLQYYIAQLVVAHFWKVGRYSWANNTISDLGNTHCGYYGKRLVCSPEHIFMNLSFVLLGITMACGALILRRQLAHTRLAAAGFYSLVAAGLGTVLVGLFPENTVSALHITGAALPFILGNAAMILIGSSVSEFSKYMRLLSIVLGGVGLVALALFMTSIYFGLGIGGMERVTAYPQSVWMIITGLYLLARRDNTVQ